VLPLHRQPPLRAFFLSANDTVSHLSLFLLARSKILLITYLLYVHLSSRAQNQTGKHISLISKKDIRYEGVLYSINEQNATVALQNVRSFGTEGREKAVEGAQFVAPSSDLMPFLVFRGQDIKDLHVHEQAAQQQKADERREEASAADAAPAAAAAAPPATAATAAQPPRQQQARASENKNTQQQQQQQQQQRQQHPNRNRKKPTGGSSGGAAAPGTGASLLNRKARGIASDNPMENPADTEFDFQANLEQLGEKYGKVEEDGGGPAGGAAANDEEDDEAGDVIPGGGGSSGLPQAGHYEKDDFFDSISCEALDKASGVNNRLRGRQERSLNTETFGAVALNTQRRGYRGGGGRGRGRGGRGGYRGGGGGGRGRGYRGGGGSGRGYYNSSNRRDGSGSYGNSGSSGGGGGGPRGSTSSNQSATASS